MTCLWWTCVVILIWLFLPVAYVLGNSLETWQLAQRLVGESPGGNYTYYKLTSTGQVMLVLQTLQGDADIYVSTRTNTPNYALNAHEIKSATCGIDSVSISPYLKRPVWIGIYGYPGHDLSKYVLSVYASNEVEDDQVWKDASYSVENANSETFANGSPDQAQPPPQKESMFGHILELLFSIASFCIEILLEVLV